MVRTWRTSDPSVPSRIVVGTCGVCDAAVWMFNELGLIWALDPMPVTGIRPQPIYRVNRETGKAITAFRDAPDPVFKMHVHQGKAKAKAVPKKAKPALPERIPF